MSFEVETRSFPSPDGPLRYAKIPWDSDTFGHPIYELQCDRIDRRQIDRHLPALLRSLSAERPVLVWAKIPLDDVAAGSALTGHGFYPAETLLQLRLSLDRFKPVITRVPESLRLRPAAPGDLPLLISLARAAFHADRFHLDPHLDKARAGERFGRWLERAQQDGEPIFVYEETEKRSVLGFYHVRELARRPPTIDLSLAAIDSRYQKLGFGLLLYQAVLLEFRARGYAAAETRISVNNLEVLNLFARLGFSFRSPSLTLHWFRGTEEADSC